MSQAERSGRTWKQRELSRGRPQAQKSSACGRAVRGDANMVRRAAAPGLLANTAMGRVEVIISHRHADTDSCIP